MNSTLPPIAFVAGSGITLRGVLDDVREERAFDRFPGLSHSTIAGHDGAFLFGRCAGREVIVQSGRRHVYEGLSYEETTRTVDLLAGFGVREVVFTNAAGGLRDGMQAGCLAAATQILSWSFHRFTLPETIVPDFILTGCDFEGIYCWMHGPCYETRAEITALQRLGGATVGMSAAPELARCKQLGLRGAVISCITNSCLEKQLLTHEHVVAMARTASARLCALLRAVATPPR